MCHVILYLLYAFFCVVPRRLNFICQRFGTHCLFHLHRRVGMKNDWGWECWDTPTFSTPVILHTYTAFEDGTECSETSAYKIQTPGNYPRESLQHSDNGESSKSRIKGLYLSSKHLAFVARCGLKSEYLYVMNGKNLNCTNRAAAGLSPIHSGVLLTWS